jgi:hypothetical protein
MGLGVSRWSLGDLVDLIGSDAGRFIGESGDFLRLSLDLVLL